MNKVFNWGIISLMLAITALGFTYNPPLALVVGFAGLAAACMALVRYEDHCKFNGSIRW